MENPHGLTKVLKRTVTIYDMHVDGINSPWSPLSFPLPILAIAVVLNFHLLRS